MRCLFFLERLLSVCFGSIKAYAPPYRRLASINSYHVYYSTNHNSQTKQTRRLAIIASPRSSPPPSSRCSRRIRRRATPARRPTAWMYMACKHKQASILSVAVPTSNSMAPSMPVCGSIPIPLIAEGEGAGTGARRRNKTRKQQAAAMHGHWSALICTVLNAGRQQCRGPWP